MVIMVIVVVLVRIMNLGSVDQLLAYMGHAITAGLDQLVNEKKHM